MGRGGIRKTQEIKIGENRGMRNRRENLEGRKNSADMPERWQYDFTTAHIPHPLLVLFYIPKSLFRLTQLSIFHLPSQLNNSSYQIPCRPASLPLMGVIEADHMLKLDKTSGDDGLESSSLPVLRWGRHSLLAQTDSCLLSTADASPHADQCNALHISAQL